MHKSKYQAFSISESSPGQALFFACGKVLDAIYYKDPLTESADAEAAQNEDE